MSTQPDADYDTEEKLTQTDVGYQLSIKCKRGTGTNDRDEVKGEYRSEEKPTDAEIADLRRQIITEMTELRAFQPDAEDEPDD